MTVRQFVGLALLGGAWLGLGAQDARAQGSTSQRFAQLLLVRESQQIHTDSVLISQQNNDVRTIDLLEASPATVRTRRLLAQFERTIVLLQSRINTTTTGLVQLDGQVMQAIFNLPTPNPRYSQLAASNSAIIATFAARPPYGIPPVTSSQ